MLNLATAATKARANAKRNNAAVDAHTLQRVRTPAAGESKRLTPARGYASAPPLARSASVRGTSSDTYSAAADTPQSLRSMSMRM